MITSVKNETIKEINKLKKKKYRDETGLFLVEGYHLVEEARKHKALLKVICATDEIFEEETIYVSDNVMSALSFTKSPQPVMGICKKKDNHISLDGNRILLLDEVQDPGNLGTIIRTSLALGVDLLILSDDTVDLYNDKVLRATQGAIFKLDILIADLKEIIPELKNRGFEVYGLALENAEDIESYSIKERMAFIMGNEGNGISKEVLSLCDHLAYIPISTVESLNVGIATAITLWQFKRH